MNARIFHLQTNLTAACAASNRYAEWPCATIGAFLRALRLEPLLPVPFASSSKRLSRRTMHTVPPARAPIESTAIKNSWMTMLSIANLLSIGFPSYNTCIPQERSRGGYPVGSASSPMVWPRACGVPARDAEEGGSAPPAKCYGKRERGNAPPATGSCGPTGLQSLERAATSISGWCGQPGSLKRIGSLSGSFRLARFAKRQSPQSIILQDDCRG